MRVGAYAKNRVSKKGERGEMGKTAYLANRIFEKGDANGEETKFDKNSVGEKKCEKPHSTNRQKPHKKTYGVNRIRFKEF